MNTCILLALLASVAVSAVPTTPRVKRECTLQRHANGHSHKGTNGTGHSVAPSVASAAGPDLSAVVALGEYGGDKSGGGKWRSSRVHASASQTMLTVSPSAGTATGISKAPVQDAIVAAAGMTTSKLVPTVTSIAPISSSTRVASSSAGAALSSSAPPAPSPSAGEAVVSRSNGAGLAINEQSIKSFSGFLKGNLGWYTGWAYTPLSGTDGLEWVPQVWGLDQANGVQAAAAKWPSSVKYVLSFNEPDMSSNVGGSSIDAKIAAAKHIEWVEALGGTYQIGAPAVARGSKRWMDDWVAACAGQCKYDFVPFHFYGTNANELIKYAQDFYAAYKKPLWITEWSCIDYGNGHICTDAEVKAFMKTAVDWFRGEGSGIVRRWAYFGAFPDMASGGNPNGLENPDGSINAMGQYYISL